MEIVKSEKKYKVQSAKDLGDFVQVQIKDEGKILVPLEDYFMMAVKINSYISQDIVEKYKKYQDVYKSYIRIKNRILSRDSTMYELEKYCKNSLKLNQEYTSCVLDMVKKSHLVDDHKYALEKSKYYQDIGFSKKEIRTKLNKVGIQQNWIDEAIFSLDDEKEYQNAFDYAKKNVKMIKGKSISQVKMTLIQKLSLKGFSYDISNQIVDDLEIKEDGNALLLAYKKAERLYSKETGSKKLEKIRMYCVRKGFSLSQVNEIMEGEEYD